RNQEPIIQTGNCNITESNKNKLDIIFNVNNVTEETKIELPFIYYAGYSANINGEELEVSESNQGFVQITIKQGQEGKVEVKYKGTLIYYISLIISVIGSIGFIIYII